MYIHTRARQQRYITCAWAVCVKTCPQLAEHGCNVALHCTICASTTQCLPALLHCCSWTSRQTKCARQALLLAIHPTCTAAGSSCSSSSSAALLPQHTALARCRGRQLHPPQLSVKAVNSYVHIATTKARLQHTRVLCGR